MRKRSVHGGRHELGQNFLVHRPTITKIIDLIAETDGPTLEIGAGVGGATMMTAQAAPWFTFELHGRVPAYGFTPQPSIDGGLLAIRRRDIPLVADVDQRSYANFVHCIFTGRGRGVADILRQRSVCDPRTIKHVLDQSSTNQNALPRDLSADQWAALWKALGSARNRRKGNS